MSWTSNNPKANATVEQGHDIIGRYAALGVATFGLYANSNSGAIVPESDFAINSVPPIANLLIKTYDRPDDPDNPVPSFDEYVNVGMSVQTVTNAPNAEESALRLMGMLPPEAKVPNPNDRINNLPGVQSARSNAITKAWAAL